MDLAEISLGIDQVALLTLAAKYGYEVYHFESQLVKLQCSERQLPDAEKARYAAIILYLCTATAKDRESLQRLNILLIRPHEKAF